MAVEKTPERSLSDLLSHLARGLGDDRVRLLPADADVVSIRCSVSACERAGIREEGGDARERLVLLGVEDVQDGADQERVSARLPVVLGLLFAGRVDQDVGDVLGVLDLVQASSDLQQRVEPHRVGGGRLEAPDVTELAPPSGRQRPVLLLDVVDDDRVRPGKERRDDEPHALCRCASGRSRARARGRRGGRAARADARSSWARRPDRPRS